MTRDGGAPASALGVDVGGANLKWARASGGGEGGGASVSSSGVVPFPLWRDPGALTGRLQGLGRRATGEGAAGGHRARHASDGHADGGDGPSPRRASTAGEPPPAAPPDVVALSLTGELADCFPDRAAGVRHIVEAAREVWGGRVRVFCRDGAWRRPDAVEARPGIAAAANWRAPAEWLARRGEDVLLADMGSTTTDLVPVRGGEAGAGAPTDLERLAAGELVYTGLLRTPVCAMVREVELEGATVPVAAERFAVAADAHLWLGSLEPDDYRCEPPDGGPVTREAAGRRLARMVCSEPDELGPGGVDAVARAAADAQAHRVVEAVGRLRRRAGGLPRRALATGAGADLLAAHLRRAGLELAEPPAPLADEHAAASTATTLALLALHDAP